MLFTLIFAVQQIIVLYERDGTSFTTSELINYQETGHSIGVKNGFRVAFAIYDQTETDYAHRDNIVNMEIK